MKHYTKDDVGTRNDDRRRICPAVNVKAYNMPYTQQVEDEFHCSEKVAERALQFAFESECQTFWEWAPDLAREIFAAYSVDVEQAGRSGGWLLVQGLPNVEQWDAVLLAKWRSFEIKCRREVEYRTSWENMSAAISANRWAEEYAEQYNFADTETGRVVCLADANKAAAEARAKVLRGEDQ